MQSQDSLAELAKKRFDVFIAMVDPGFIFGKFSTYLISKLQAMADGELYRLCLAVPPRHGKSRLCSELLPAWLFARSPKEQIMEISYSSSLAGDFGVQVRAIMESQAYKHLFPEAAIAGDGTGGNAWRMAEESKTGRYLAVGVDGSITGKPATWAIGDDPIKNRFQAESLAYMKQLNYFFGGTLLSRLEPNARCLIIHTRWTQTDLIGWLLSDEERAKDWEYISFPAIAMENDVLGRKQGDALFPERYDEKALANTKRNMPPQDWAALYQCDPEVSQSEASPWQSKYWQLAQQSVLACDTLLISIDAASELHSKADFTGITIWLRKGSAMQCIKAMELKLDFTGLLELVKKLSEEYSLSIRKPLFLLEKASNGIALGQYLQGNCKHIAFEFASAHTNKKGLLKQACNVLELNDVSFCSEAILVPEQLSQWPALEHDDIAISAMQALVKLASLPASAMSAPATLNRSSPSKYKWD